LQRRKQITATASTRMMKKTGHLDPLPLGFTTSGSSVILTTTAGFSISGVITTGALHYGITTGFSIG